MVRLRERAGRAPVPLCAGMLDAHTYLHRECSPARGFWIPGCVFIRFLFGTSGIEEFRSLFSALLLTRGESSHILAFLFPFKLHLSFFSNVDSGTGNSGFSS